mmetsp:Transcript_76391/g.151413  ORF Transcript_76391/g.151413 Transcript_76391/m.151413 type:complete len:238 (+) Transcript_76391:899-1612(+)
MLLLPSPEAEGPLGTSSAGGTQKSSGSSKTGEIGAASGLSGGVAVGCCICRKGRLKKPSSFLPKRSSALVLTAAAAAAAPFAARACLRAGKAICGPLWPRKVEPHSSSRPISCAVTRVSVSFVSSLSNVSPRNAFRATRSLTMSPPLAMHVCSSVSARHCTCGTAVGGETSKGYGDAGRRRCRRASRISSTTSADEIISTISKLADQSALINSSSVACSTADWIGVGSGEAKKLIVD